MSLAAVTLKVIQPQSQGPILFLTKKQQLPCELIMHDMIAPVPNCGCKGKIRRRPPFELTLHRYYLLLLLFGCLELGVVKRALSKHFYAWIFGSDTFVHLSLMKVSS